MANCQRCERRPHGLPAPDYATQNCGGAEISKGRSCDLPNRGTVVSLVQHFETVHDVEGGGELMTILSRPRGRTKQAPVP